MSRKESMNPKVNFYFEKAGKWQEELKELRIIALNSGLTEELKWGCPCYTFHESNVVLIHSFKEYCAFLFMKGALLKDPEKILIQQTENVQSARQIRFTNTKEIKEKASVLKEYIDEAVEVERSGLKVNFKKTKDFPIPEEFQKKLDEHAGLKEAFDALTPGRQRAYLFYFGGAKQSNTREARVEKYMEKILQRKGMDDA